MHLVWSSGCFTPKIDIPKLKGGRYGGLSIHLYRLYENIYRKPYLTTNRLPFLFLKFIVVTKNQTIYYFNTKTNPNHLTTLPVPPLSPSSSLSHEHTVVNHSHGLRWYPRSMPNANSKIVTQSGSNCNTYIQLSKPNSQQAMADSQTDRLLAACAALNALHVGFLLRDLQTSSPTYTPPLSQLLETAAFHDNPDVASYCLELGAPITDSVLAEIIRGYSFATYKVLVSHGLDTNRVVPWFGDILIVACQDSDISWARFCLENGADPNLHMVNDSMYALAATAQMSTVAMADLLLQHGAKMEGSGAIVLAAEEGKLDMVKFLLDKGADIDEIGLNDFGDDRVTEEGGSALHKAVTKECGEVVRYLLDKGAVVNLLDIKGRTPLMRARENESDTITELLKTYGATK